MWLNSFAKSPNEKQIAQVSVLYSSSQLRVRLMHCLLPILLSRKTELQQTQAPACLSTKPGTGVDTNMFTKYVNKRQGDGSAGIGTS